MKKLLFSAVIISLTLSGCGSTPPKACSDDFISALTGSPCGPKHPINIGGF